MCEVAGIVAGVVLSAASKCDTPNVKGTASSHRAAVRPSTGEPKQQPTGQRAGRADPPGRLQRTASAEAGPAAAAASPISHQSSAPPAALEAASAQVTAAHCSNWATTSTTAGCNTDSCATAVFGCNKARNEA